jgi:hypothetical protein
MWAFTCRKFSCDEFSDDPREELKSINDEGTSPTVKSLLNWLYAQMIGLTELLNTSKWLSFPTLLT